MLKKFRYMFEAVMVQLLFTLLRLLPFEKASALGGWLGEHIGPHLKVSQVARTNLMQVFPDFTAQKVEEIVKKMWNNLGRTAGEFPHMAKMTSEQFHATVTVVGEENLEKLREQGGIIFSGHIGNWEMAAKSAFEYNIPLSLVYRPANNPYVDALICKTRKVYQAESFPKGREGAKDLLRSIAGGKVIAMLVDQKMNDGISVPFFGREAMTAFALGNVALKYKCPVVPARVVRVDKTKFRIDVLPPMEIQDTGDRKQDIYTITKQVNEMLETWITEYPEQWFWVHHRWPKEV